MTNKLAAVSVDLDEIDCYAAIHGLDQASLIDEDARRAIYRRALPRLTGLFERLSIPVTFFAIGRDLVHDDNRRALAALHAQGHEIANHSLNHFYDLTRREREVQRAEIAGGADAIEAAVGVRPRGFRAPGYTVTDALLEVLAEEGALYDASVFPCPPYYLAKVSAIAAIKLRGRTSHSIVDHPRVMFAPAEPYRIGKSYTQRGEGLVEIPNGVTSNLTGRLPFIGTSVALAGERGARVLASLASRRNFVSLELHGIDLADADEDGLTALAPHQPDLRKRAADKEAALVAAIETLARRGFRFVTLADAAHRL